MSNSNHALRVFLCHANEDKPKIKDLYRRLKSDGMDAWLDEVDLLPGQEWRFEIENVVREKTDVIIVCLTANSIKKEGFLQKEIKIALDVADEKPESTIFIIPAKLEPCNVPNRLSKWQWVDLFDPHGYERLLRALKVRHSGTDPHTDISIPELVKIPSGNYRSGITNKQIDLIMKSVFSGKYNLNDSAEGQTNFKESLEEELDEREVFVGECFIGKYPITNQEFDEFVKRSGYVTEAEKNSEEFTWRKKYTSGKERYPVVYVSWNDAIAYCKWLSGETSNEFGLPTADEWLKAFRGKKGNVYPWGDIYDPSKCNSQDSMAGFETTEVGIFEDGRSDYGVYDLLGNVDEYTSSTSRGYKIALGGSWKLVCEIYGLPFYKRLIPPSMSSDDRGFRIIKRNPN